MSRNKSETFIQQTEATKSEFNSLLKEIELYFFEMNWNTSETMEAFWNGTDNGKYRDMLIQYRTFFFKDLHDLVPSKKNLGTLRAFFESLKFVAEHARVEYEALKSKAEPTSTPPTAHLEESGPDSSTGVNFSYNILHTQGIDPTPYLSNTGIAKAILDLDPDKRKALTSNLLDVANRMSQDPIIAKMNDPNRQKAINKLLEDLIDLGPNPVKSLGDHQNGKDPLLLTLALHNKDLENLLQKNTIEACTPFLELMLPQANERMPLVQSYLEQAQGWEKKVNAFLGQRKKALLLSQLNNASETELKQVSQLMTKVNDYVNNSKNLSEELKTKLEAFQWSITPILLSNLNPSDKHTQLCHLTTKLFPDDPVKKFKNFFMELFYSWFQSKEKLKLPDSTPQTQKDLKEILQTMVPSTTTAYKDQIQKLQDPPETDHFIPRKPS